MPDRHTRNSDIAAGNVEDTVSGCIYCHSGLDDGVIRPRTVQGQVAVDSELRAEGQR